MLTLVRPGDAAQEKRPSKNTKPCLSLTEEEAARLRTLIVNLHRVFTTWAALSGAMGVRPSTLTHIACGATRGSPGVLLLAARVARMTVEQVLSGKLDVAGRCPTCGRGAT